MATRVVLVIGALALALGACGDDDDGGSEVSEAEQPYVDALIESAAEESDDEDDEFDLDEEQAECVAPAWVGIIGADRLEEAGVEPDELPEDDFDFSTLGLTQEDGEAMYDALGECGVEVRDAFIAGLAEDESLSDEDRQCVDEAFDEDLLRRIIVTGFVEGEEALDQDEELMGEVFAVFAECPGAAPD